MPAPFLAAESTEENMKTANLLLLAIALTDGNFTYQWLGPGNYAQAFDRSFFQLAALALVAIINKRSAIDAALGKFFRRKELSLDAGGGVPEHRPGRALTRSLPMRASGVDGNGRTN
jgi:hypothetical protein